MHHWKPYVWRCLLITLVYGAAYAVIRGIGLASLSVFNWIPLAALRLSCMLLMPIRYWPALVIGELVPLGYANYRCLDEQGITWVLMNSIPAALKIAPIVWLMRRRFSELQTRFVEKMPQLLAGMAIIATASALFQWFVYSLMKHLPPGERHLSFLEYVGQMSMGGYLAMLSFTPLALWLNHWVRRQRVLHIAMRARFLAFMQTAPWRVPSALLLADLGLALWGHYGSGQAHFWAMAGMLATLIPIAWYGVPVMAVAGAGANIALVSLMRAFNDLETLQAQAFMVLLMTAVFACAYQSSENYKHRQQTRKARFVARHGQRMDEQQRAMSARYLSEAQDHAHAAVTAVIRHKAHDPQSAQAVAVHAQQWRRHHELSKTIFQGMQPHPWWDLGNPDGPIVAALLAEGIYFQVTGLPRHAAALELSDDMKVMLPRFAREVLFRALHVAPTDRISLSFSVRLRDRGGWDISITAESHGNPNVLSLQSYERLLVTLGVQGLTDMDLDERAHLYGGGVNVTQEAPYHARVVMRLIDDDTQNRAVSF